MTNVSLTNVVKTYGSEEIVHSINLEIAPHEFVVLVGPSGCGKSTTLRMIAGLEEITSGEVHIGEKLINNVAPKDRDVAMVFQNYALYPHLTVAKNIAFGLNIRKVKKDEIERQVAEVSNTLELTELLERRPAELSGGQRQRVAMGRAIVRHPKVFLFDEPLSNLDAKLRTQMRAEIRHLHNRLGVTSIYVTHDQVEAMTLADRIVVMNNGNIEQIGTPMELFRNPKNTFVASFIGSPPMNQLKATVKDTAAGQTAYINEAISIPLPQSDELKNTAGKEVIIGIRPEHANLNKGSGRIEVPCQLELVELLGAEALIHLLVNNVRFIAKVETHGDIGHLNAITSLFIQPSDIRVFDSETGKVISNPVEFA